LDVAYVAMAIHGHVSSVCFKCFACFQPHVASVSTGSGGAHIAMAPVASGQRPAVAAYYCCWGAVHASPCRCLRLADASRRASVGGVRQARGALLYVTVSFLCIQSKYLKNDARELFSPF